MNTCVICTVGIPPSEVCKNCQAETCADCREGATGSKERCPACGGYVGSDQNCRVGGGGCGK